MHRDEGERGGGKKGGNGTEKLGNTIRNRNKDLVRGFLPYHLKDDRLAFGCSGGDRTVSIGCGTNVGG
jgi:hypothetical protein